MEARAARLGARYSAVLRMSRTPGISHVGDFGHLLMMGLGGHITHEDTVDNLTLFSKEVLPRLAELG